ncbi:hypothetical protein DL771_000670 [Monosporascus sp. 5C6A]|nr:hypothetical protein DL771_000670 [Monosporascus sp. 5C6A]
MAATRDARGAIQDAGSSRGPGSEPRLLWNPENVKDVAESVGIGSLGDEALRTLAQDVEYRIGQVIVEALRFMRAAKRTTMTVQDISQALKVLDVEPLYGYDSTRPLRYGEASLGPGQPLFYIEDEEVDFEKLINAPLPKVPRDMSFTAHWLAVEGVQPSIPQNPSTAELRGQDLLPKGPGANPTLAALAGHENATMKPAVKHIVSKEQTLYFEKIQAALLDDTPDAEVRRLRESALESVSTDPGIHQLVPYFVNFISHEVTHHNDDVFVLRQMMELTGALIQNPHVFLDPYASPLSAPVLTCLVGRKLGPADGTDAIQEQYRLREFAASLIGQIAKKYSPSNKLLRPKLTRSCLKYFLDPMAPSSVWYGAILGVLAAGGPEAVRILVLPNLKDFESSMLAPLREKGDATEFEVLVGGILKAVKSLAGDDHPIQNGVNGYGQASEREAQELKAFVGEIIGEGIAGIGDRRLNQAVLDARSFQ